MVASNRSLPLMLGRTPLLWLDVWEEPREDEWEVEPSASDTEVLLRRLAASTDGEHGMKESKRVGGGDDSGDELCCSETSARDRKAEGGIIRWSAGGEDKGDVAKPGVEAMVIFGRGVARGASAPSQGCRRDATGSNSVFASPSYDGGCSGSGSTAGSGLIRSGSSSGMAVESRGHVLRRFAGRASSPSSQSPAPAADSARRAWRAAASNWAWTSE